MTCTTMSLGSNSHCPTSEEILYKDDFEMDVDEAQVEEEVLASDDGHGQTHSTNKWDHILSVLEAINAEDCLVDAADILLDDQFEAARAGFCRQHCGQFEDSAENKLCYTDLFQQYCSLVEGTIVAALSAAVPDFSMEEFATMLEERHEELGEEVLDFLMSLSDFGTFKEAMLAYRREAAATPQQKLLGPCCCAIAVHKDEQEEGEERPDLDLSLTVSPLMSPNSRAPEAAAITA